ncbi:MAG: hypothetical protein AAGI23_17020 [Bacteroidota bacterium]
MHSILEILEEKSLSSDLQEIREMNEEIGFDSNSEPFGSTSLSDLLAGEQITYVHEPLNVPLNSKLLLTDYGEMVKW